MKEKDRLNQLFDQARSEKPIIKQNHIDDLVKSGKQVSAEKIKLGKAGRGLFNPLNLIIMISIIAIISSVIFIFSGKPDEIKNENLKKNQKQEITLNPDIHENQNGTKILLENTKKDSVKSSSIPVVSPEGLNTKIQKPELFNDTIIKGKILFLSKEQLSYLGFEFDETGYFYLNELPDGSKINFWSHQTRNTKNNSGSAGFGRGGFVNQAIKKSPTSRDYYPVCTSSLAGDDLRVISGLPDDFKENFEGYNDTLVPIAFLWISFKGYRDHNVLAWFKVSQQFYTDLGIIDDSFSFNKHLEIKNYLSGKINEDIVTYDYSYSESIFDNTVFLDSSLLDCLGFKVSTDSLIYSHGQFDYAAKFWFTSTGRGLESIRNPLKNQGVANQGDPMLFAVSDPDIGFSMQIVPQKFYQVDSTISPDSWIDICVPVKFNNDEGQLWEGSTFWYYPTEELFNCLPDSIGDPMRKEFNVNVAPRIQVNYHKDVRIIIGVKAPDSLLKKGTEEAVPCEYFPSFCEGLPGLEDLNVYPNPATDIINLDVTVGREKSIDFRVFDISGRLMVDDMETKKYPDAGMYKHQIDISSLTEGFYLLVLTDDEGARMTKRIIKN